MKTKRMMAALVVALLSVTAVMAKDIRTAVFKVSQMHCENCERKVKSNIKFEKGVKEFSTDLKTKTVSITYDAEKTTVDKLKSRFQEVQLRSRIRERNETRGQEVVEQTACRDCFDIKRLEFCEWRYIHNSTVMNQMMSNTISILLLRGGGVPEGGGGR